MNYIQLIKDVGGYTNIQDYVYQHNTLTFTLENMSLINLDSLNTIENIQKIEFKNKKLLIYFNEVNDSSKNFDFSEFEKTYDELSGKDISKARKVFDVIIQTITQSINPVVPLLAGAGMGKVLLIVLELLNILSTESTTYEFLKLAFETPFFFLPALVGFSAGKVFDANRYVSGFLGLLLVNPSFTNFVDAGIIKTFLGVSVPLNDYSAQIIPSILAVWGYSYVETFFKRIVPEAIRSFIAPLFSILVMTPLVYIVIAPTGMVVSEWVAQGVLWSADKFGFLAIGALAAVYPWLVTLGVHKALSPVSIMLVAQQGFDPVVRVIALSSNISQAAASLAVAVKAKDTNLKSIAQAGAVTAFLGGYTQTALYGVNLKLRTPMIASMIGAATAGVYAGLVGMKAYAYVTPAIFSLPMWIGSEGNYLVHAIITILISTIVTFVATMLIGFDEELYIETN